MLSEIRRQVSELLLGRQTIDKLLRDKLEDFILVDEIPLPVRIGDRTIYVGNLTLENYKRWIDGSARLFGVLGAGLVSYDLFGKSDYLMSLLLRNRILWKELCRLIGDTVLRNRQQEYYVREMSANLVRRVKLPKVSTRFFMRNVTMEKLVQITFLIYQYNFDAVKKNFSILANKMDLRRQTETYIYSWLENCPGLSGAFVTPASEKSDSTSSEPLNEPTKTPVESK